MNVKEIFFRLKKYKKITRDELYELGVDDDYIEFTLENEILFQIDDNTYTMGNAKHLLYYGRGLIEEEEYEAANNVFDCAYDVDMTDFEINFQLLYRTLKQIKVKRSHIFRYFDVIYNGLVDSGREYDANYYVLLLGNLYGSNDIDKKNDANPFDRYRKIFVDLEEDDILLIDGDRDSLNENMLRKNVFSNSYHKVTTMVDKLFTGKSSLSFEEMIEKELLLKWLVRKRDVNGKLAFYLKDENIEDAKSLLNREDERRNLTKTNEYILKLVNSYLTYKKTGVIPTAKYVGDDIFDAIDGNNYELALKLEEEYSKDHNITKKSALHMMLVTLNKMIKTNGVEVVNETTPRIEVEEEKKREPIALTESEMQSIDAKVKQLRNGRMLYLLDPMSHEKRALIRDYVKFNYEEDIATFSIGLEPERRVVLRYKPVVREHVEIKEVLNEAKNAYSLGKYEANLENYEEAFKYYEEALKNYELVMKIGKPFASTYSGYGMTLYRLNRKKEALDSLKVATIMSKTESNGKINFTDLIEKIENPPKEEDKKPKTVVYENEFEEKNEEVLDNEIIEGIISLITDGGMKLEDILKEFNLNELTSNYVKLIYARDNYYIGNDYVGDKYFKQVEKSKAKDSKVKKLYNEIKVNKKYYHNRYNDDGKQLVFIKK